MPVAKPLTQLQPHTRQQRTGDNQEPLHAAQACGLQDALHKRDERHGKHEGDHGQQPTNGKPIRVLPVSSARNRTKYGSRYGGSWPIRPVAAYLIFVALEWRASSGGFVPLKLR